MAIKFSCQNRSDWNRDKSGNQHQPIDSPAFLYTDKPSISAIEYFSFGVEMVSEPIEDEFTEMKEYENPQGCAG
jgi:hypothetical protein